MVKKENIQSCLVCGSDHSTVFHETATMMAPQNESWEFRKCSDCTMVYLSPRVITSDLGAFYTHTYLPYRGGSAWGKYSNLVEGDQKKVDAKRVATVQKYAPNAYSILDIGCGKPSFLLLAQKELGVQSIGIDFSDEGWKNETSCAPLRLYKGAIHDLPPTIKADVITMWHYLEHDYHPSQSLKFLSGQQDKDAMLIIEVPNHDSYTRKKYDKFWSGYHTPRHTGLYTPETMKLLLETNGWKVEDQYSYGSLDPYTLDWMSRKEKEAIDWSASMEPYFFDYVIGKLLRPRYFFDRYLNLGFMTMVARNTK